MIIIKMEISGINSLVHEPLVSTIELKTKDSVGVRLGQMLYTLERQGFFVSTNEVYTDLMQEVSGVVPRSTYRVVYNKDIGNNTILKVSVKNI